MNPIVRRLEFTLLTILGLVALGTIGYRIAGLSWVDAVYQTVITISTVGYNDLAPNARLFTVLMVGVGTLSLAILISVVTGSVVEIQLRQLLGRRKLESAIRNLKDHFIICGGGRFGRTIAYDLRRRGADFVLIDPKESNAEHLREEGFLVLTADATEESALKEAGIDRARGLLATLPSDADNVYVTITARQLAPRVSVVSIALDERAARKLKAAGADEVVAPYVLGGNWMAQIVTSPTVADFMKMATGTNAVDFYMDEQRIAAGSRLAGTMIKDTTIRSELGVIVVAVRRADGELVTNPPPDLELKPDDVLVSLGQHEKLAALKRLAGGDP